MAQLEKSEYIALSRHMINLIISIAYQSNGNNHDNMHKIVT